MQEGETQRFFCSPWHTSGGGGDKKDPFWEGAKLRDVRGARLSRIHVHTTWAHPLFPPQSEFFPPQFGNTFSCIRETKISLAEDSGARPEPGAGNGQTTTGSLAFYQPDEIQLESFDTREPFRLEQKGGGARKASIIEMAAKSKPKEAAADAQGGLPQNWKV